MNLHPPTVHFPIAFWTAATIGDFAGYWTTGLDNFVMLAFTLGTLSAAAAIITGLRDFSLKDDATPDIKLLEKHLLLAITASFFYGVATVAVLFAPPTFRSSILTSVCSSIGFIALVLTGHNGGMFVHGSSRP